MSWGKMMGVSSYMALAVLTETAGTFLMSPNAPQQFPLPFNPSGPLLCGEVQEKHRGDFGGHKFCHLASCEKLPMPQPCVAASSRNPLSVTSGLCSSTQAAEPCHVEIWCEHCSQCVHQHLLDLAFSRATMNHFSKSTMQPGSPGPSALFLPLHKSCLSI